MHVTQAHGPETGNVGSYLAHSSSAPQDLDSVHPNVKEKV